MSQHSSPELQISWELEDGPNIARFERSQLGEVSLTMNPEFAHLEGDLQELFQNANSEAFTPLTIREQMLDPYTMNLSRKMYFTHQDHTDRIFVVGGLGPIQYTSDELDTLAILPPSAEVTFSEIHPIARQISTTIRIKPNGDSSEDIGDDPMGGYTPASAEDKYNNTARVRDKELFGDHAQVIENVAYGTIGEGWGIYAYSLPRSARNFLHLADHIASNAESFNGLDLKGVLAQFPFYRALYQTARAQREIQDRGYVPRQHHPGNVYWDMESEQLVVADFTTLQNIASHRTKKKRKEKISPKGHAKWNDTQKSVTSFVSSSRVGIDSPLDPEKMLMDSFTIMMLGYTRVELDDPEFEEKARKIKLRLQVNLDAVRSNQGFVQNLQLQVLIGGAPEESIEGQIRKRAIDNTFTSIFEEEYPEYF